MSDKNIELAKKLKALADRGVAGERDNAMRMLSAHLKRHNISIDDISEEKTSDHRFIVTIQWQRLFNQIAANMKIKTWTPARRPNQGRIVTCTTGQLIELDIKFNFYKKEYEKELLVFFKAFVAKNDLYNYVPDKEMKPKTPEEKAEDYRAAMMAAGIKRAKFIKQIEK